MLEASPLTTFPRDDVSASVPVEPPSEELSGCVDITRSYTSVPPTVMLLIDQSESMRDDFGQTTRWQVLRDAIVEPENGLLTWLDGKANLGAMFYTSIDGYESGLGCPLISGPEEVQFGNAERIRAAYYRAEPMRDGDTPTAESIDAAAERLNALGDTSPKYILLITDGIPDTCDEPDPQNGLGDAVQAVERAYAAGVRVRTVGVSEDVARTAIQWMANAGAGKPPRGLVYGRDAEAERPLFASTDSMELAEQLKGVIGDVRSCSIELGTLVGPGRAFEGSLALDGSTLTYGDMNGWTFVDDDTLRLHGSSCERVLADGERLEVRFPCVAEPAPRPPPPLR